ncbi:MAG: DUF4349 domain-containing protein [Sphingobacteriales bacterium]|nr:MAG: DUF4349 domain-containing protein [Sphingobacteriales bacterium]
MKRLTLLIASIWLLLATGCQNASTEKAASYESVAAADGASAVDAAEIAADSVKLVKTGALQLQVADVDRVTRELTQLTQTLGGRLFHQELTYQTLNRREVKLSEDSLLLVEALEPQALLSVRIPAQNLDAFLFGATDKSLYPLSRSLDIDDQSLRYLENVLKVRNRTETLNNGSSKGLSKNGRVAMGDEAIDQTLANRQIDADVRYSVVNLQLKQHPIIRKETVANTDISAYRLPAGKRFAMALGEGGRVFADVLFALLHLWVFILIGVGILMLYRFRKAKRRSGFSNPTP